MRSPKEIAPMSRHSRVRFSPPRLAPVFRAVAWPLLTALALSGCQHTQPPPRAQAAASTQRAVVKVSAPPARTAQKRVTQDGGNPGDAETAARLGLTVEQVQRLHTERALDNRALAVIPPAKLARALWRIENPKPDHPGEAAAFRRLQQLDEAGQIEDGALVRALDQRKGMAVDPAAWEFTQSVPVPGENNLTAGIQPGAWTSLGPGNIGGRTRCMVIHPTTPATMWAGSVGGGLWKTTNSGTTWAPLDDFMASLAVSSLVLDPTNPNVLYAGTGEGFYNGDGLRGAGIFRSTNGGTTWTQLSATANSNFHYVNRIAISPANNQIMLAATRSGIWRTTNGGTNWVQTISNDAQDVDFHPTDGTKAVAAGYSGMIRYSNDGGATWIAATGLPASGRIEVAYAPSSPTTVYASCESSSGQVYRSVNGGATYTLQNTGTNYLGSQGWYDNLLWVDPTNPAIIVVGGIDLYRSTNSGVSLTKISQWFSAPSSAHADHHLAVAHPGFNGTTNKTVFFANDGGVYRASDLYTVALTSGWQELNNNYGVTQFYGGAGSAASGRFVGGTQDNGTLRYTTAGGSEGWTTMFGGDGGWCASDPGDANYFYGEYVFLQIHRSTNGGNSSNYIYSGITDATNSAANFISPFILDPNNANTMLGGGASLWRSTNVKAATPSWTAIKGSMGSNISAICVAPGNSNVIWVGHNNGNVYYTTNGTAGTPTWTQADLGSPNLPNRYCHRIVIDPLSTSRIYVCFGGFSADNVYRTTNNGVNWTDVSGALPSAPIRSLQVAPFNSSFLYVGTEVGVFASANAGATWSPTNEGPANVSVDELFWVGNKLTAATHGRGFYSIVVSATPSITAVGSAITSESCPPGNGAPDPDETVTVNFSLRNEGAAATNLVATLQATGGVTFPSASQTFGAMATGTTVSRPFTFIADGACGGTLTATLQLQEGATNLGTVVFTFQLGANITAFAQNFDGVTAPALPASWTTTASGAQSLWVTTTGSADSAPNAAFSPDPTTTGDNTFTSPAIAVSGTAPQLSFRHKYDLETLWDGGVLEIKIGAGAFTDIVTAGGSFVTGGYTGTLNTGSALGGRMAWTGAAPTFGFCNVLLPAAAVGETVQFRWRCATDSSVGGGGWYIDNIAVTNVSCCEGDPDLSVTMSDAPDPVVAGQNLTWTIGVANNGTVNATNVVLTDSLPADVAYVSSNSTQGTTAANSGGNVTATLGTLSPGSSATITIVGTPGPDAGGTITNTALATASEADENLLDNTASTTTTVHHPPVVNNVAVSTNEDVVRTFAAANFTARFSDPNGDALVTLRITSLPANGVLKLSGVDITTAPTDIPLADIATLQFMPATNFNGATSFGWNASDGALFALSDASVNITVNAVNDNPAAGPDTIARYPSQSVKVLVAALLANDTDIDNQPLTLAAVGLATPAGAAVTQDGTWVYYTPPPGSIDAGGFAYTVGDGNGGTADGLVTVNIIASAAQGTNLTKIETLADGSKRINFAGIPGRSYRVQSTDNLASPYWLERITVTADPLGRFQFTEPPPLPPARFYRSVSP